ARSHVAEPVRPFDERAPSQLARRAPLRLQAPSTPDHRRGRRRPRAHRGGGSGAVAPRARGGGGPDVRLGPAPGDRELLTSWSEPRRIATRTVLPGRRRRRTG